MYIGGGTPSCLEPDQLKRLFSLLAVTVSLSTHAEVTIEANPNTISLEKLDIFLENGVNRVSIGVQSFRDEVLRTLGRTHTADEARNSVRYARQAGFRNINVDLIYGIPGQDHITWYETIDQAILLAPEHLSLYSLSLDNGAPLKRLSEAGLFRLPDDDMVVEQYEHATDALARSGYALYELSNFARSGFECSHNMNYWERGEYLGLGPGAYSFLGGRRTAVVIDPVEYENRLQEERPIITAIDTPSQEEAAQEHLLLGLRTAKGISLPSYQKRFGNAEYEKLMRNVMDIERSGLVQVEQSHLSLTRSGRLLADEAILHLGRR